MIQHWERKLLVVWLIVNLMIGFWVVQDYGMSTDEPYYYLYAEDSLNAFESLFDSQSEPAYGVENLRYYGPAFILMVNMIVKGVRWLPINILDMTVWHFAYFVTFQLTGLCLYGLIRRWFSVWTAWSLLVLFITQPLLWGHAFINPKDIPFMFFFTLSISAGFRLADSFGGDQDNSLILFQLNGFANRWRLLTPHKKKRIIFGTGALILSFFISRLIAPLLIERSIKFFYSSEGDSWSGKLMRNFAENISSISIEDYIIKAQIIYFRVELIVFAIVFLILGAYLIVSLGYFSGLLHNKRFLQKSGRISEMIVDLRAFTTLEKIGFLAQQFGYALIAPKVILAGAALGLATSVRILGPLAGVIVVLFMFFQGRSKSLRYIVAYILWGMLITYITWPFLWASPISRIIESIMMMANFPWSGTVLFDGKLYYAANLPISYLPVLLNLQFTEIFMLIWYFGLGLFVWYLFTKKIKFDLILYIGLGFLIPLLGFVVLRPPLYENFRQLLFLIPAMFLIGAFSLEILFKKFQRNWLRTVSVILLVIPSLISLVKLHPYQYIYYNSLIGGVDGAFRRFELDYWYTSYSEFTSWVNENADDGAVIVTRVAHKLILPQVRPDIQVLKIGSSTFADDGNYDYAILTTRWNTDQYYPEAEIIAVVERDGGILGVLKRINGESIE